MSDYTGYNMPTGCSNMDIPGFDCSDEEDYCAECGQFPDECECPELDYHVDDYDEEEAEEANV